MRVWGIGGQILNTEKNRRFFGTGMLPNTDSMIRHGGYLRKLPNPKSDIEKKEIEDKFREILGVK